MSFVEQEIIERLQYQIIRVCLRALRRRRDELGKYVDWKFKSWNSNQARDEIPL